MLTSCGNTEIEDYATNEGYTATGDNITSQAQQDNGEDNAGSGESEETGIPAEKVKIGVVHLTSPDDGNGYTYTHDLGLMSVAIIISFACYFPVVLWAKEKPMVGMLMMPKTMAYIWMICMGLGLLGHGI